jgi:acid stress chaperone HdeA
MLLRITGLSIVTALLTVSSISFAAETKGKEDMAKKKVTEITCEDFNGLEDSFKPTVIAWAEGFRQGSKKPNEVTLNIDGIEKVTPMIVEACQKEPKASLWSKAKAELKKVF